MNTSLDRTRLKLKLFADFANRLANLSTCRRRSVGCVMCPPDFTAVWAIGYNGPRRGAPNDSCQDTEGSCGCAHAELNAVQKLWPLPDPVVMVCTVTPCVMCANAIVNSGRVRWAFFVHGYRDAAGLFMLQESGIVAVMLANVPNVTEALESMKAASCRKW